MSEEIPERFCGCDVNKRELDDIREIVSTCNGISRTELANTVCELLLGKGPQENLRQLNVASFLRIFTTRESYHCLNAGPSVPLKFGPK